MQILFGWPKEAARFCQFELPFERVGKRCRPDAGDVGCLVPSNPGVVTPSRAFVLSGLRRSAQPVLSQNPTQY